MDTFYTRCPVIKRTNENIIQYLRVGGELEKFEFEKEVVWLQKSESKVMYRHGGEIIKEGETYNDFYGYLTSCEICSPGPVEIARKYSIDESSTLELVVETVVFMQPAIETKETRKNNNEKTSSMMQFASLPLDWSVRSKEGELERIESVEIGRQIVWSSQNSPDFNSQLLRNFQQKWAI